MPLALSVGEREREFVMLGQGEGVNEVVGVPLSVPVAQGEGEGVSVALCEGVTLSVAHAVGVVDTESHGVGEELRVRVALAVKEGLWVALREWLRDTVVHTETE